MCEPSLKYGIKYEWLECIAAHSSKKNCTDNSKYMKVKRHGHFHKVDVILGNYPLQFHLNKMRHY